VVTELIPDLTVAFSEPGESEPLEVDGKVIPKRFTSIFLFEDGAKTWSCRFDIKVTELGTPKLMGVHISGSVAKDNRPHPTNKTWDASNKDELMEIMSGKRPRYTEEELERIEFLRKTAPEPDSVHRWQLKRIEQYRFQLFELGVRLAYSYEPPRMTKFPSGTIKLAWLDPKQFSSEELKELQKEISKKIRKKITPDFLQEVAKIYSEAQERGEFPTKAVAEFYKCKTRTAEDYVKFARENKFLPPVKPIPKAVSKTKPKKKGEKLSGKSKRTK
jgi:hypothetical protein